VVRRRTGQPGGETRALKAIIQRNLRNVSNHSEFAARPLGQLQSLEFAELRAYTGARASHNKFATGFSALHDGHMGAFDLAEPKFEHRTRRHIRRQKLPTLLSMSLETSRFLMLYQKQAMFSISVGVFLRKQKGSFRILVQLLARFCGAEKPLCGKNRQDTCGTYWTSNIDFFQPRPEIAWH